MEYSLPSRNPDSRTTKHGCILEVFNDRSQTLYVVRGKDRTAAIDDIKILYPSGGYGTTVVFDSDEAEIAIITRGNSCD